MLRALLLALAVLAVWSLCAWGSHPHPGNLSGRGPAEFSALRADAALGRILGPELPDPVSSANNARVRERIQQEFAAMGVSTRIIHAFTCNGGHGVVACATINDILAEVAPGSGAGGDDDKAIVLLAHYDSVPAGPGASDDKSGVVTVTETVRALKARGGPYRHPVIALLTDGEEAGLLGAGAFLENKALKDRVGAVINVEARGTSGPSLLFQTSPGDGRLVDLYARSVPEMATSSLYAEIYRVLPNDTDLTPFLHAGFPAFNFAFADNVRYYHSPFDLRRNLSLASLQMHGDNMLGVANALEQTGYAALKGGDAIYLDILGAVLPRMPKSWALPFALLMFFGVAAAAWLGRETPFSWRAAGRAAAMPLLLIVGCVLCGFVLLGIAAMISGVPDPTYAYPWVMRLALGFGVFGVTLLAARLTDARGAAASAWLWMAGLGIVTAALLPGISPYFTFPSLVAAVLMLAAVCAPAGWRDRAQQAALGLSALAALIVWMTLVSTGEILMGLSLHELFTVPAAFGLMTVTPMLRARMMPAREWRTVTTGFGVLALVLAVAQGLAPAYSARSPQRANILYFQNQLRPAHWIVSTTWKAKGTEPPPAAMIRALGLARSENAYDGLRISNGFAAVGSAYVAPAGPARFTPPAAEIVRDVPGAGRIVTLHLKGSAGTDAMLLAIPRDAGLTALDIRGEHLAMRPGGGLVVCLSRDCGDLEVTMTLAGDARPVFSFAEQRYGLPDFAAPVKATRPDTAMASQSGDGVILANSFSLPR